jgi:bacillithiol system protein YtxJ
MEYIELSNKEQLKEVDSKSFEFNKGVLIFKHSRRCSISQMALGRFSRDWDYQEDTFPIYFLDLISFRDVSNEIAEKYEVMHESPQILLIKDGKCIYSASHMDIKPKTLNQVLDA